MSVYINPIANGITVSLMIIYLAFIPVLIYQYRKKWYFSCTEKYCAGIFCSIYDNGIFYDAVALAVN